ncbi:hypothetical protein ACB087_19595 [Vibrio sp. VNB-15]
MNKHTQRQILSVMAPYQKRGIPYRAKQVKRLLMTFFAMSPMSQSN